MYTERHFLETLPPNLLDMYLAKGWYRMGQGVFTCRFLIFNSRLYSAIWVRLALSDFQFSKSQRKLFRKLDKQFVWEFGPLDITREKEALYKRYERHFQGRIAPTLASSLHDDGIHSIFDSWEVCIRDRASGRLVAYSVFDRGRDSLTSIVGIYDPEYASYSLGYFTMLLEVLYAQNEGYTFYYPGYVAPGYSKFDYKLRVGPVSYFVDDTSEWVLGDPMAIAPLPHVAMEQALLRVQSSLEEHQIKSTLRIYPPYEANILGYWVLDYLEYPLFLQVHMNDWRDPGKLLLVVYNHIRQEYIVHICHRYEDLSHFFEEPAQWGYPISPVELDLLIKSQTLEICQDSTQVLQPIQSYLATIH